MKTKLGFYATLVLFLFIHYAVFPSPVALGENLPENPIVQAGDPTITSDGSDMTVNAGSYDKTWIDWQGGFNIGAQNSVNNIGPDAAAVILHNDISGAISDIQGALNGNCNVFLLNPSGVLFGAGAQVNVGGLVVSTLKMSMDDFMSGDYKFNDDNLVNIGAIVNAGDITANSPAGVTFIAGAVKNEGVINANLGTVNLVSGSEVTLNINNEGSIQVAVNKEVLNNVYDKDGNRMSIGVDNVGDINANGGQVYIQAEAVKDVFDTLINQSGVVKAGSMVEKDGKIILVSNSEGIVQNTGTLDTSAIEEGAAGGEIKMLGENVRLFGNAVVDASGYAGGGTIDIGGNYQGKGPDKNSLLTVVGKNVDIKADAGITGDGGKIVIWSDGNTYFAGDISAKGGSLSGDGGFVEVSGKENLGFYGTVNTTAANGELGTLLLDPTDITIHDVGEGGQAQDDQLPDIYQAEDDLGDVTYEIDEIAIEDYLTSNIILEASNSITINNLADNLLGVGRQNPGTYTITFTAGGAFAMDSTDTISSHGITITGSSLTLGSLTTDALTAGNINLTSTAGTIDINGTITTNGGSFTASANYTDGIIDVAEGATINVGVGNMTLTGDYYYIAATPDEFVGTGALTLQPYTADRSIGLAGAAGDWGLTQNQLTGFMNGGFSSLTIGKSGGTHAIVLNALTLADPITLRGGSITINSALTTTGAVTFTSSGAVDINHDIVTNGGAFNSAGTTFDDTGGSVTTSGGLVTVNHSGAITVAGTINAGAGGIDIDSTGAGSITLSNSALVTANSAINVNNASGIITSSAASDGTAEITSAGGTITLEATSGIIDSPQTGGLDIDSGGGAVSLTGDGAGNIIVDYVSADADAVSLTLTHSNTGNITYNSLATGLLTVNASSSTNGNISINNDAGITAGGALAAGGSDVTISGVGAININGAVSGGTDGNIVITSETGSNGSITSNSSGTITAGSTSGYITLNADDGISLSANATTTDGAVTVDADTDDDATGTFAVATGVTVTAGGDNNMTITATDVTLTGTGALNAAGNIATIQPSTAKAINLGTNDGTSLALTDTELDNITATTLRLGSTTAGAITITEDISPANITNLSLLSDEGVSQQTGDTITVSGLRIDVDTATTLNESNNDVTTLAVNIADSAQAFSFADIDDLTIGTVDGTSGITTNAANITVDAAGALTMTGGTQTKVSNSGDGTVITLEGLSVTLGAGGAGTETVDNNGTGTVTISASSDDISLGHYAISADEGLITLAAQSGEILAVNATGTYEIDADGNITMTAVGIGSDTNNVEITGDAGADRTLTITSTAINGEDIDITEMTAQFNTINLTIGDADVDVDISLAGANDEVDINGSASTLTLNSLDGQDNNRSFSVTLTEDTKTMAVNEINSGTGTVTLVSSGPVTDGGDAARDITAATASITADGGIGSGNALDTALSYFSAVNNDVGGSNSNILITNTLATGLTTNGITNYDGGNITVISSSPLTVAGDDITTGDGDITLTATEDGGDDDTITVNADVTIKTDQGNITLNAGQTIDLAAGVLVQTGGDGTIDLNADDADGDQGDGDITMNATALIQTTGTGAITLDADDDLTITNITSGGALTIDSNDGGATGVISLNGNVNNTTGTIAFSDAVSLAGASVVSSTDGSVTFSSTIDGAQNLTASANNGTVTFGGIIGGTVGINALTVTAGTLIDVNAAITDADSVTFNGNSDIGANITATAGALTLNGTNNTISGGARTLTASTDIDVNGDISGAQDLTLAGTNNVMIRTIGLSADPTLLDINTTALQLEGDITVDGNVRFNGATTTTVAADVIIDTTGGANGTIVDFAALNGNNSLTIAGGDADVSFAGTTQLTGLTVSSSDTVDFTGVVSMPGSISITAAESAADTIDIQAGATVDSTTGSVTLNGPVELNAALSAGTNVTINGATTLATGAIVITADNGNIVLNGDVSGSQNLTLSAANGNVELNTVGTGNDPTLLDINSATATLDGATIVTAGQILLDGVSMTTLNTTVSMTSGNNTITLGPLDGDNDLTLVAGTGAVNLGNADINDFTVTSSGTTDFAGDFNATGAINVTASDTISVDAAGTVDAAGALTFTASSDTGTALIDIDGAISSQNNITLDADGTSGTGGENATVDIDAAITAVGTLAITADVAASGDTASIDIAGGTAQAGGNITIASDDTVAINSMVDSTGGTTSIDTNGSVSGIVTINAVVRGTTVTLDTEDSTGTITISTDPNNTRGGITVNQASVFNLDTSMSALNNITVTPATTLGGASTMTSTSGNVTFTGAINGANTLAVNALNGTATFTGAIGNTVEVTTLTVSADIASLNANISSEGNVDFTGTDDVVLTSAVTIDSEADNNGSAGYIKFKPTGAINGAQTLSLDAGTTGGNGGAIQLGTIGNTTALTSLTVDTDGSGTDGTTTLYGSITANTSITLTDAKDVNLAADISLLGDGSTNMVLNGGDIAGDYDLIVVAGSGVVTLGLTSGETEIDVNKLTVTATGQTNIAGNITADEGIDFSNATNVDITTDVTLTNTDSGTVDLTGGLDGAFDLTISANATDVNLGTLGANASLGTASDSGTALTVTSTGTTTLNGNITATAGEGISFGGASNVVLGADVQVSTGAGGAGNIIFANSAANSLSGAFDLTLIAGTGAIQLDNITQLTSLTVSSSDSTQFVGATDMNGGISVAAVSLINVDGSTVTTGGITLDSAANVDIDGVLTAGGNIDIDGDNNVAIDANITVDGNSTITITADSGTANNAGDLTIAQAASASITSNDGNITLEGENITIGTGALAGIVRTTGSGNVKITANRQGTVGAGDFTIAGTGSELDSGGTITVDDPWDVTIGGDGLTSVGNITISADNNIDINAPVNSTLAGNISMTADAGNITLSDEVRTTSTGDVTMTATAGYIDDDDAAAEDEYVAGDVVTMTASGGIGATTSDIDTQASSLNLSSTTAGNIVIDEYNDVVLTDLDTVNGSITVSADGLITATDVNASGSGQDVTLTTTTGGIILTSVLADDDITATADAGNITIALVGDAGTDDITITATTGAIDEVTPEDAGIDITGDVLTLNAQDGVGQSHALEIDVNSLNSSVTAPGDITIHENGAIILTDLSTVDGTITVTAGGLITASSVNASGAGQDVSLSTTTGGMILTSVLADDDITATADAGDITIDVVGDAGTDDVTITATTGSINGADDDDDAAEITADAIVLTAQDEIGGAIGGATAIETEATTVSADSTSAGDIIFKELDNDGDGINLLAIDTNNGNITIQTNGGIHEDAKETIITSVKSDTGVAGSHDISITASTGDITLAGNTSDTTNAQSDDDITITATAGSITEKSTTEIPADSYVDIQGDLLTIAARDEIGSSTGEFDIETTIASLDAISTASGTDGGIIITETNAITIVNADITTTSTITANISITAGGTITVADNGGITDAIDQNSSGAVTLDANGAASDVIVNDVISSVAGAITITADNDVTFAAGGDITSTSGNVSVTADADNGGAASGALTMDDGTLIDAGSGTIALNADENITLGGLLTTNTTNTAVTLTSTEGGIVDGGDTYVDVAAASGRLVMDAVTGIGSANDIETTVGSIDMDNSTSGNINIDETNAITIAKASQATTGNINIVAGGTITVDSAGSPANAVSTLLTGTVTLDANGAASDIAINDGISTASGNVTITADNDVTFAAEGDITSTSGNVSVTADADNGGAASGALTMTDGALINAGSGTITLTADEDITLGGLLTTNATNTAVVITTIEGGIVDGGDTHVDVVAASGRLVMDAVTEIGSAAGLGADPAIETTVASIDGDNTTSGNIKIDETNAVTLTHLVNNAVGSVDVTAAGTITTTIVTADHGAVNLYATAGDILDTAGGLITAAAESTLKASGIVGTEIDPIDVNIDGKLWILAESMQNEVSANIAGTVNGGDATERVEILLPAPPGLVMLDNRLMGGGNYGSNTPNGSILSFGYGYMAITRADMFSAYYQHELQPWGYKMTLPWVLSEGANIDSDFLSNLPAVIDVSALSLPALNQTANFYVIRSVK